MAEVIREIIYRTIDDELVPVLVILPKVEREGHNANFCIRMEDLWMYTPDKNPNFDKWMYYVVRQIYDQFNLGVVVSSQRMAQVASVIEDGIEELLSATPEPLLPPATPPGGGSGDGIKINGNKVII